MALSLLFLPTSLPLPPRPNSGVPLFSSSRRRLVARGISKCQPGSRFGLDNTKEVVIAVTDEMGISKVTGIAATALLVTSIGLWEMGMRIVVFPLLATSFVASVITFASHNAINLPWILGKNSVGRFPLWSFIVFGPFLMLARAYTMVKRFIRKESVYDKIAEGLYLGGWPFLLKHLPPGGPSVIDCTCELPRSSFVPEDEYLCLPTWDTRAPGPHQIELAARWACEKRSQGKPVYVHCAFGHGRSACVICAILVATGIAEDWKDAENFICDKRKTKMNAQHQKNLEDWSRHQIPQKKEK